MDSTRIMREQKVGRLLVTYSAPVFLSYLCNSIYNIISRAYIGNGSAGHLGIAALSVAFPISLTSLAFAFLLGMGGSTLAAIRVGQEDREGANRAMNMSLQLLLLVSIVITAVGNLFLDQILVAFGASEAVLPYAREYARIIVSGCVFQIVSVGMTNYMRVEGKTRLAMLAVIIGPIVNIIFSTLFIKVFDMGLTGAGLATIMAQFSCTAVIVVHYIRSKEFLRFDRDILKPDVRLALQINYLGLSAFALQICNGLVSILINQVARRCGGDIAVSGMGVVTTLQNFVLTITSAVNMGSQSLIAYSFGARLYKRIRELVRTAMIGSVVIVLIEYIILRLWPVPIASIFGKNNAEVIAFSSRALVIYLMMSPLVPIQIQGSGFFQAIKKPIHAMLLSLTRQAILLAPLLLTLPRAFGAEGMFWAGPAADLLSVAITLPMLLHYMKKLRGAEDGTPLDL